MTTPNLDDLPRYTYEDYVQWEGRYFKVLDAGTIKLHLTWENAVFSSNSTKFGCNHS